MKKEREKLAEMVNRLTTLKNDIPNTAFITENPSLFLQHTN